MLLWALIGKQGSAGLTLPGDGISTTTAMLWEMVLTTGLVSVILGTASGAQAIGPLAAIGVGSYIALAGLWGAPVSGASMNPARSLGPALVSPTGQLGGRISLGRQQARSSRSASPMCCAAAAADTVAWMRPWVRSADVGGPALSTVPEPTFRSRLI